MKCRCFKSAFVILLSFDRQITGQNVKCTALPHKPFIATLHW